MARVTKAPEQRRQEIIDTAFDLFRTKGYQHTTVRDIVSALNVAQGLFYYYFKNKDEVLYAIIAQQGDSLITEIARIIADDSVSPLSRIQQAMGAIAGFFYSTDAFWRHSPAALPASMSTQMQQMASELLEPYLSELLEQGAQARQFSLKYPVYTSRFLLYGFLGLIMDAEHPPGAGEILELVKEMIERILVLPAGSLNEAAGPSL